MVLVMHDEMNYENMHTNYFNDYNWWKILNFDHYLIFNGIYTYWSETNGASRLNTNGNDAILVRALLQLTDSLAQEAQPIHEGPEYIHKLLRSAVS